MNPPDFLDRTEEGLIRVRGHRIGLEDVVFYHREGYSPEMIVGQFPTLPLAVVYKVNDYYLENRSEVDEYVARERRAVQQHRDIAPKGPDMDELRQRLAKRQQSEVS
jgi:uncharacterized protein (DUF433 family)